ncbi:unnamed protein product [Symbiodinium natans]|uniref:Fungal lipase-type domain-containing protein n=1 Tax=Symbiodinium natans TaxID=878477 RepID=A0A812RUZ4_9DINO|nr:unnamed protein product [Symbiodinium natans]
MSVVPDELLAPESRCKAMECMDAEMQSLRRSIADLQLQLLVKEVVHAQVLTAALRCWSNPGSATCSRPGAHARSDTMPLEVQSGSLPGSEGREPAEEAVDAQSSWNSTTLDPEALPIRCEAEVRCDDEAVMSLLRELQEDLAASRSRPEPRPSTTSLRPSQLPIEPNRLEELVAANLSQWVYRADDVSEPLPEIPGISLVADCVREDLHTGSVKVALVTAELPGRHRTLFVVFKGSSYLLDFINWNLEHDYEVIGDGTHFMHKGAAGVMRNLFFFKVQSASSFAKQLDAAYDSGVRHLVLTGHSLGGMYAMSGMYFIWREMQTCVPERSRLRGPGRALLRGARCVAFGAPMCFGRDGDGPGDEKYSKFEEFLKTKAVNFVNAGDPCPRAWSAVDLRAVIREAAEAMKEQLKDKNLVSRQIASRVIQALSSALLSRPDMDRHIAGCAAGFLHLSSIRVLSREDRPSFHWQRDFRLSRHGFADHAMSEYCDLLFDACYAEQPTCHMYDDDDAGTKVPLTRIRPSFVARLRRSDSEPRALEAAENELAESTATVTSLATSAVPDQPSLQELVEAVEHGRMSELEGKGKSVSEALQSYKAKASAQGHFCLGSVWIRLDEPIPRDTVTKAIHKYHNTWPVTLEAKGRQQMALREAQLLLLALDAHSAHKAQVGESSEKARSWHSRRSSARSYASESNDGTASSFWRKPSMLGFRPWRRNNV